MDFSLWWKISRLLLRTRLRRLHHDNEDGPRRGEDVGLGIVSEKVEPPSWYPTRSPPMKGTASEESDGSETLTIPQTHGTSHIHVF